MPSLVLAERHFEWAPPPAMSAIDRPADDDFQGVRDYLFYDLDVLHLYDPAADGVEDPESDVAQAERFANLHPRHCFKLFLK